MYYRYSTEYDEFLHKSYMQPPPPPPKPPPDDDNAKVARHQEQEQAKLESDILNLGEAGWRSQYYTGKAYLLPVDQITAYQKWKTARENWTRTGETEYLKALREAVDFSCPPDASAFPTPVPEVEKHRLSLHQHRLLTLFTVIWTTGWLITLVLTL